MGGGVIRTAAKAAVSGSFRSSLVDEAGRRAARQQVSSFVPAVQSEFVAPTLSAGYGRTEASAVVVAAHRPHLEFDDWVLTGGIEESFESAGIAPRLVFGPVPTLEEAMEATTDLKDALEKVYFTPQHTAESNEVCQATSHGECSTISSAPKHVTQMFYLLQENSEAQDVVASLASDENVWNAVMKNEKVVQFCKKSSPEFVEIFKEPGEFVAESHTPDVFSSTMDVKETSEGSLLNKIKVKVSQMVNNISDFIKDSFGISTGESSSSNKKSTSENTSSTFGAAASFLGLAVAAILVILLKRG